MRLFSLVLLTFLAGCQMQPPPKIEALRRPVEPKGSLTPEAVRGLNDFALDLARAADLKAPWCLGTVGVDQALAVLLEASDAATFESIAHVLRIEDLNLGRAVAARRALVDSFRMEPGSPFTCSASIWTVQPVMFHPDFVDQVDKDFGARLDKAGGTGIDALRRVNEWCLRGSLGRVQEVEEAFHTGEVLVAYSVCTLEAQASDKKLMAETPVGKAVAADIGTSLRLIVIEPKSTTKAALSKQDSEEFRNLLTGLRPGDASLPLIDLQTESELERPLTRLGGKMLFEPVNALKGVSIELMSNGVVSTFKQVCKIRIGEVDSDRPVLFFVVAKDSGVILALGATG